MNRWAPLSAIAAVLLVSASASAQQPRRTSDKRAPDIAVGFDWSHVVEQKVTDYQQQLALADAMSDRALAAYLAEEFDTARVTARRAHRAYANAAKLEPNNLAVHWRAAEILAAYDLPRRDARMASAAIYHWNEFQRLAPLDPRVRWLLFPRAVAHTYVFRDENCCDEQLRRSLRDYEYLLQLYNHSAPGGAVQRDLATTLTNAAEVVMTLGDIDRAMTLYRHSLEIHDTALTAYGLAVALDRDGQRHKALELMARYAGSDQMRSLKRDSVFFIPNGDVHYYKALGHESLGDYSSAEKSYRAFLRKQGKSRYAAHAKENLEHVRETIKRNRGKTTAPARRSKP